MPPSERDDPVKHPLQTQESMSKNVMRFDDMKQHGMTLMFIDCILPEHWRMNFAVIGAVHPDMAYARLRSLTEGARIVSERLWA